MNLTSSRLKFLTNVCVVTLAAFGSLALAKGGGAGYWLEGTVAGVRVSDNTLELVVSGRLWLDQYPDGPTSRQIVEFECPSPGGIAATLTQAPSFFAMSIDWRAGALRKQGHLSRVLQLAATRGSTVKLQLQRPRIDFRDWGCPTVVADVIRATDADLK